MWTGTHSQPDTDEHAASTIKFHLRLLIIVPKCMRAVVQSVAGKLIALHLVYDQSYYNHNENNSVEALKKWLRQTTY